MSRAEIEATLMEYYDSDERSHEDIHVCVAGSATTMNRFGSFDTDEADCLVPLWYDHPCTKAVIAFRNHDGSIKVVEVM